ncbi:hypothetical protein FKM82_017552 [Ascaphus truei]
MQCMCLQCKRSDQPGATQNGSHRSQTIDSLRPYQIVTRSVHSEQTSISVALIKCYHQGYARAALVSVLLLSGLLCNFSFCLVM